MISFSFNTDFLSDQKRYERVRTAIKEKLSVVADILKEYQLSPENLNILIVAYKNDDELDIYAKSKYQTDYKKIKTYRICSRSGQLGPKRKQGDGQVPEGFYHINRFNPFSNFYLSLGINYPNLSDKRKSKFPNLGGDIFIHGSCVTIGCLPVTDDFIKEIYLFAVYSKNNGQSDIPVYIFPFKMTEENMNTFKEKNKDNPVLTSFWANLKEGYDLFIREKKELKISVNENGDYVFQNPARNYNN